MSSAISRQGEDSRKASRSDSCLVEIYTIVLVVCAIIFLVGAVYYAVSETKIPEDCTLNRSFPKNVLRWCKLIEGYADRSDLPPDLIAALIWQESGGNPYAFSSNGAVGLMQVMPRDGIAASFQCKKGACFEDRPSSAELQDPEFNIRFGTQMLKELINDYEGNLREALKSYGPMGVGYSYADTVLSLFNRFNDP